MLVLQSIAYRIYSRLTHVEKDVCLVGGIYPPDAGGPSKFLLEFENFLLRKGKTVYVVVLTNDRSSVEVSPKLTKIRISRIISLPFRFFHFIRHLRRLDSQNHCFLAAGAFLEVLLANLTRASRVIVKIPGDIVWERARNSGATHLDILEFQNQKLSLRYWIMRQLYTQALKSANQIIVPSEGLKKLTRIWGIDQSRVELIYNSVDVPRYAGHKERSGLSDVLTVCRLTEWKGVDELISAVSILDLSLTIIGDGPERNNLERLADSLGAKVTFLGEIDSNAVIHHYKRARRFVLNSSYEGLPHVLLEARASKLLCLAKEGTGSSEVISHLHDGILYGGESGLNLVQALNLSFSSKVSEELFVERAYTDIELRFNQSNNFDRIFRVLTNE